MTSYFNSIKFLKSNTQVIPGGTNTSRPIQNKARLPLEIGLTFSFTLPPIPPSVSDLKIEKVKTQLGLDLEVWILTFCLFGVFPSNFCQLLLVFIILKI